MTLDTSVVIQTFFSLDECNTYYCNQRGYPRGYCINMLITACCFLLVFRLLTK